MLNSDVGIVLHIAEGKQHTIIKLQLTLILFFF